MKRISLAWVVMALVVGAPRVGLADEVFDITYTGTAYFAGPGQVVGEPVYAAGWLDTVGPVDVTGNGYNGVVSTSPVGFFAVAGEVTFDGTVFNLVTDPSPTPGDWTKDQFVWNGHLNVLFLDDLVFPDGGEGNELANGFVFLAADGDYLYLSAGTGPGENVLSEGPALSEVSAAGDFALLTPEPGSGWLVGTGLVGVAWFWVGGGGRRFARGANAHSSLETETR